MPGDRKRLAELVALQEYLDSACRLAAPGIRNAPVSKYIEELLSKYADFAAFYLATERCRVQYI